MKKAGLIADIYRNSHYKQVNEPLNILKDCTSCVVVGDGIDRVFEPTDSKPEVHIKTKNVSGRDYVYAVPAGHDGKWLMFGGNFIWSSDSRFRELSTQPIPLHDRVEPWER